MESVLRSLDSISRVLSESTVGTYNGLSGRVESWHRRCPISQAKGHKNGKPTNRPSGKSGANMSLPTLACSRNIVQSASSFDIESCRDEHSLLLFAQSRQPSIQGGTKSGVCVLSSVGS